MSVIKSLKRQELGNSTTEVRGPIAVASRHAGAKKPGTRVGTLDDWRLSGKKTDRSATARRERLRDGR